MRRSRVACKAPHTPSAGQSLPRARRALREVAAVVAILIGTGAGTVAGQSRPDVVLFLVDDQPLHEQEYMPLTNDLIGNANGVTFTQGAAHAALCAPSRATILTGLYVSHHGLRSNDLSDALAWDPSNTVAVWLQGAGYRTALIGKYLMGGKDDAVPVPPGWDTYALPGNADRLAKNAVSFINATPTGQPLFLVVSFHTPHYPAVPLKVDAGTLAGLASWRPGSFDEVDVTDKPSWVQDLSRLSSADKDSLDSFHQRMAESLSGVDRAVQSVANALAARGRLANSVLIYTSDHGLALGDHRIYETKNCSYEECLRIPFLIRAPDAVPHADARLVSLVDLAPTIADYARVVPPVATDGRSLRPLIRGRSVAWPGATLHDVGFADSRNLAIRSDRWLYAEYTTGERELYDLAADPWELRNRAGDVAFAAVRDSLSGVLDAMK